MAGVSRFEDLHAWKLAVDLRDEVLRLTETGLVLRDRDFRGQIRDSARSAPRNLSEGFDKFSPREFCRYARIARGSIAETKNHVLDGLKQGYFTAPEADRMLSLSRCARAATTGLMKYLHSCKGQAPTGWDRETQDDSAGSKDP